MTSSPAGPREVPFGGQVRFSVQIPRQFPRCLSRCRRTPPCVSAGSRQLMIGPLASTAGRETATKRGRQVSLPLPRQDNGLYGPRRYRVNNDNHSVLWWMIWPRRDGNTRSSDAGSIRAASNTARAAVESGTRCGRRIFVRSIGTVHRASSTSISVHRAPRVSLERVAVRMTNRMARAAGVPSASRAARAAGDSWDGVEAKCRVGGFRLGRTPSDDFSPTPAASAAWPGLS